MHSFITLARIYPYWAIPVAIIFAEIAYFYKRRKSPHQFIFWMASATFILGLVLWLIYRGDINSDVWVQSWIGSTQESI